MEKRVMPTPPEKVCWQEIQEGPHVVLLEMLHGDFPHAWTRASLHVKGRCLPYVREITSVLGGRPSRKLPLHVRATSTEFLLASRIETWNQGLMQASDPLPAKTYCRSLGRGSMEWPGWGLSVDSLISYHIYEFSNLAAVWEIHLSLIVKTCRSLSNFSLTSSRVL